MSDPLARVPLIHGVSQFDVDFVIPVIGADVPLGIDPFLLFKSRDPRSLILHGQLIDVFNAGIAAIRDGKDAEAFRLFDLPEVPAIGLGYAKSGRRGSGIGPGLSGLIIDTVRASPGLQERGIRHIEEMQLISVGIGADRVSDMAANLLTRYLIEYTQQQCVLWNVEMKQGVPLKHVFDPGNREWSDVYEDLPVSPVDGRPMLLVPRRWVRALPWINYDHFFRTELRSYLEARRSHGTAHGLAAIGAARSKPSVIHLTQNDVALIDSYVRSRENQADQAEPSTAYLDADVSIEAERLKRQLKETPPGRASAHAYQLLVLEILNFLFSPGLAGGMVEVATIDGTERRDIVFTNESEHPFWGYVRSAHDGIFVMFEVKNLELLDIQAINQVATYLGDRIGRLGFIATRNDPSESIRRKIISVWNDSGVEKKVILVLSDSNFSELLEIRCKGGSVDGWIQNHYRRMRTSAQ